MQARMQERRCTGRKEGMQERRYTGIQEHKKEYRKEYKNIGRKEA